MSQGVPEFGVWNAPNVESYGFTNTFDVVRKVRRDRSSMDHIPIQQTIDRMPDLSKRPATSSGIGERVGNEKSRVGYDKGEIWEMESAGSAPNNFALQTGQSQRPPTKHQIERIRHELSPAKYQKVLASRDDPKVRQERPRTGTSSGSTNAVRNFPSEAGHRRRPSSSNDGSRRDILSSRQEEFMAKETTGPYHNPKGPTAPKFGKWNVDLNCTQLYTIEFAAVRNQKEKSVAEESNNPTPQIQSTPEIQSYYIDTPQPKRTNGTKMRCLDCLFPRVKMY